MAREKNKKLQRSHPAQVYNISSAIANLQAGKCTYYSALYPRADPIRRLHHDARMLMIQSYQSSDANTFQLDSMSTMPTPSPCFQVAFHDTAAILAAVNEDGIISILHNPKGSNLRPKSQQNHSPTLESSALIKSQWTAHQNAIFDLIWTNDFRHLATGSGDLSVQIWDVEAQKSTFRFQYHQMSVKCVRQMPESDCIFASCSRDGSVLLFDTRRSSCRGPIASFENIYFDEKKSQTPQYHRKRPRQQKSPRSVTSLAFANGGGASHQLVTAGAADSIIKFWDLRSNLHCKQLKKVAVPLKSFCCCSLTPQSNNATSTLSSSDRGVTSLALDSTRSKLLISVLHGDLLLFDCAQTENIFLMRTFTGHSAFSFYVKAAFSQDDDMIACGSADSVVYLWDSQKYQLFSKQSAISLPYLAMKGHESEVNSVQFDPKCPTKLASCSDDGTVRIWCVNRSKKSCAFTLKPNQTPLIHCSKWENWEEFSKQSDGHAYSVTEQVQTQCTEPAMTKRNRASNSSGSSSERDRNKRHKVEATIQCDRDATRQQRTLLHYWQQPVLELT